jgi:hypothetical protein
LNLHLKQILEDVGSTDVCKARDATVRATLVLERDHRGYWDRIAEAFPQAGLYEDVHKPTDIDAFIAELGQLARKPGIPNEVRLSIIAALAKTRRPSVFLALQQILDESQDFHYLCEHTDALETIGSFIKDDSLKQDYAAKLSSLAPRLLRLTLADVMAEEARRLIIDAKTEE